VLNLSPLEIGLAGAAVLAGPPLYALVSEGGLTQGQALERGALVAAACTIGAMYIRRIIEDYEHEWRVLASRPVPDDDAHEPAAEPAAKDSSAERPAASASPSP
jgi:hypothetical protein